MTYVVEGLKDITGAFTALENKTRLGLRRELREIAKPVQRDAESYAEHEIRNIGDEWWKMRVGTTRSMVYVAPKQRGVKGRGVGGKRRPKFAGLLMDKAMDPALKHNEPFIAHAVEAFLDHTAHEFNAS